MAAGDDEIGGLGVAELAERIRDRRLSPVEVVEATLRRIEARDPSLNAFVYVDPEGALEAARAAESAVMAGGPLGPLHGVPTALKDLFSAKTGWPTTYGGIPALKHWKADHNGLFCERIEAAGAILVGRTNSPAFGFRGITDNYLFGPTGNPFDATRNPGGSSGGSAAAVGDGMLPFAEATDGGGSIRIPAAWSGLFGYKASWGRVPQVVRPNAFSSTDPFIFTGTVARSVVDAGLVMGALMGPDPRDPFCLDDVPDVVAATRNGIRGMRIAYSPDLDIYPVDPRVAATVAEAVKAFEDAGAVVEEVKLGLTLTQRELSDLWCRMIIPLSCVGLEGIKAAGIDLLRDHPNDLPPQMLPWIEHGYRRTVVEDHHDQAIRTAIFDAVQAIFGRYDLLVSPTLAAMPVKNATDGNTIGPMEINGEAVDPLIGWCMTVIGNFTGHPAASIPAGLADGLPVGLQIMGRRGRDIDVFAASAAFEAARPWAASYAIPAARPLTPPSAARSG